MHNILIGITKELSTGLEDILDGTNYYKKVKGDAAYFQFDAHGWNHPHNPNTPEVMAYLDQAGEENYGFVALGQEPTDIQVCGTLTNFNIDVNRSAEIYE